MAETQRVEIGLGVGQVVTARLSQDALRGLREAVERGGGWFDLDTEEGTVALNLATVVFIKTAGAPHSIGFSE